MKLTTIAALMYLFFGLASTNAYSQSAVDTWTCGASPGTFLSEVACDGEDNSFSYANAYSHCWCTDSTQFESNSWGNANAFSGGGSEAYAFTGEYFFPFPGPGQDTHTESYAQAWATGFSNFQNVNATADKDCGTTNSVTDGPHSLSNVGTYTELVNF